ncbi:uncharacterized protein LOC134528538 [Bacillus rossius redtenbacheri]|uniref:uncharacterized protein LOC134528538 n=1 Tax=Bacillus rossius redtenbacheri TaxID=93214 RepID=UPI002FDE0061
MPPKIKKGETLPWHKVKNVVTLKKDDVKRTIELLARDKKSDANKRFSNCVSKKNTLRKRCSGLLPGSATYMALELRKCVLRRDWTSATRLLLCFLPVAPRTLELLVWRVCILILFHHPLSTDELREDFVRMTTGVDQVEGILENILRLPERPS